MLHFIVDWISRFFALRTATRSGKADEARFGHIVAGQMETAQAHLLRGDRERAFQGWKDARAQYPEVVLRSQASLSLLLRLGRFDEAEELLQEGIKRFPRDRYFLHGLATIAARRGDDEAAVVRYALLRKRHPSYLHGYTEGSEALLRLGRLDEADAVLGQAAPPIFHLAHQHARLAIRRKDWNAALTRWRAIASRYNSEEAPIGLAQSLAGLGRFDEAEQILHDALSGPRHNVIDCWVEYATIAELREDWIEAARRWKDVCMRAPAVSGVRQRTATALRKSGRETEAEEILQNSRA
ncbi:MAG: tetratricopeptide repeat protein [Acetobacteraceae bacterium]